MDAMGLLRTFMLLPAPSGYEKEMAYALKGVLEPLADEVSIDRTGNVLARFAGAGKGLPVVMVYAHMDQLGLIVRNVEPDGYLRLERLGGVPEKVLPGLRLAVRTGDGRFLPAVVGLKSHHMASAEDKYRAEPVQALFADMGAASAGEVRAAGVDVGSPAVYAPSFERLQGTRVAGTAVDNRGGCACLGLLASMLSKNRPAADVWIVGTVWEEFNLRGAMMAARTVRPDIAFGLDVALSGDTPDLAGRFDVRLGGGPAMLLYSFHGRGTLNGTIPHGGLAALVERAAREEGMPLQRFASTGLLTDSAYLQLEGPGVASVELGFPARYTHSPVEVCDAADVEVLAKLVHAAVSRIDGSFNLNRY